MQKTGPMQAGVLTTGLNVCYVLLHDATQEDFSRLLPRLQEVEQLHSERILLLEDRIAFAAGRLLVRKMLSANAPEPAEGWRFEPNPQGKLELIPSQRSTDLRFNIAHCKGLAAAVVAFRRNVGVDAEFVHHAIDPFNFARTYFSAEEVKLLEGLKGDDHLYGFFSLWTLKEAYVKARGSGLPEILSDFVFTLEPLTISFLAGQDQSEHWYLWQDRPSPAHVVAIAAQRSPAEELVCTQHHLHLDDLFV